MAYINLISKTDNCTLKTKKILTVLHNSSYAKSFFLHNFLINFIQDQMEKNLHYTIDPAYGMALLLVNHLTINNDWYRQSIYQEIKPFYHF